MNKRDWEKDWEMCEKATSEPWGYDYDFLTEPINAYIHMKRGGNCTGPAIARVYKGAREHHNDTLFIVEAREALPYWLQRVRKLEAVVEVARSIIQPECEGCYNYGNCDEKTSYDCGIYKLKKFLAELEASNNG